MHAYFSGYNGDYTFGASHEYKSLVFFLISLFSANISLATPITTLQIDSLQMQTDASRQLSGSVFEGLAIESESMDVTEMFNSQARATDQIMASKAIDTVTDEQKSYADETIRFKSDSNRITETTQTQQNEYVPLGNFTDIELDTGLFYLLEPLVEDPEFRESAKEILSTVKYVKEALFVDDSAYGQGETLFKNNVENNTFQRNRINSQNNSANPHYTPAKGTYDSSVIKEFIDKFKVFGIFLIVVIILIKVVFMLISSREKTQ